MHNTAGRCTVGFARICLRTSAIPLAVSRLGVTPKQVPTCGLPAAGGELHQQTVLCLAIGAGACNGSSPRGVVGPPLSATGQKACRRCAPRACALSTFTSVFNKAKAAHGSLVAPLYDVFKTADSVPDAISARLKLPSSDKVLRRVVAHEDEGDVLVPSTAAMGFVLRYSEEGTRLRCPLFALRWHQPPAPWPHPPRHPAAPRQISAVVRQPSASPSLSAALARQCYIQAVVLPCVLDGQRHQCNEHHA